MSVKERILKTNYVGTVIQSYLNYKVYKNQKRQFSIYTEKMKEFKGLYEGKRCFIIGTGPSLAPEDLNILEKNNEISFASNRIYEIFDKTEWRPTYYANQDFPLINKYYELIKKIDCKQKFLPIDVRDYFNNEKDITYFILKHKDFYPHDAEFSFDISDYLAQGFTVTYGLIQIARYMGFKEIYLLGIDHNYSLSVNEKGIPVQNDNVKDYFEGAKASNKGLNLPRVVESTVAYMTADKVSRKNGFRVYNATRGGKLEAFERVDFDSIFEKKF